MPLHRNARTIIQGTLLEISLIPLHDIIINPHSFYTQIEEMDSTARKVGTLTHTNKLHSVIRELF